MTAAAHAELRQSKRFVSLQHEAEASVVRTGAMLFDAVEQLLKPHGITATQYNVLRILQTAEPDGLCRNEVRDRMLTRMPDMTRLLDRMEDAGLVARMRDSDDRRLVTTRITTEGRRLLARVSDVVEDEQKRCFRGLSRDQLRSLIDLLSMVRRNL